MLIRLLTKLIPKKIKDRIKQNIIVSESTPSETSIKQGGEKYAGRRRQYGNMLKIAYYAEGGLGDFILYLSILDKILTFCECIIDFYTCSTIEYPKILYKNRPCLSIYSTLDTVLEKDQYDLVLYNDYSFTTIVYCDCIDYINESYPSLTEYLDGIKSFSDKYKSDSIKQPWTYAIARKHAKFSGLNYWTYHSLEGDILDLVEQRASIAINDNRYNSFIKSKLSSTEYIVLSRGANSGAGGANQTKVWQKTRYEEFISLFKSKYPDILTVQIAIKNEESLKDVDVIIRDADLEDVEIILKNSKVYVGSEGGIAHLASQMSANCVVLFGPTPDYYYGYTRNKNIVSPYCSDCYGATAEWFTICARGHEQAECMLAITGEIVLDAVTEIFSGQKSFIFEKSDLICSLEEVITPASAVAFIGKKFADDAIGIAGSCAKAVLFSSDFISDSIDGYGEYPVDDLQKSISHNRNMFLLKEKGVSPIIATYFNIPKDDEYFDVVVIDSEIQMRLHNDFAMKELLRVLKQNGILVICYAKEINQLYRKKQEIII